MSPRSYLVLGMRVFHVTGTPTPCPSRVIVVKRCGLGYRRSRCEKVPQLPVSPPPRQLLEGGHATTASSSLLAVHPDAVALPRTRLAFFGCAVCGAWVAVMVSWSLRSDASNLHVYGRES